MEHLELGAYCYHSDRSHKNYFKQALVQVFELFPRLEERKHQVAGTLSGGEQQMLSIGRALMSQPKFLLLDEPTMGLAPMLAKEILETMRRLLERGISAILVEQNVCAALRVADRGYVLVDGRIVLEGTSNELLGNKELRAAYLGGSVLP